MKVLCIAPHPDDETLGCGGTLLRHRGEGDAVSWLIVTAATEPRFSAEFIAARREQIPRVAAAYGFAEVVELGFPAAGLDRVPEAEIVGALAGAIDRLRPDVVYVNHGGDVHSDHRIIFDCAMAVLKPFKTGRSLARLYAYETLSETEQAPFGGFHPTSYVDVDATIDRKLEIMATYASECQPYPLPREASAIRALARWRGAAAGMGHAEAFALIREVR